MNIKIKENQLELIEGLSTAYPYVLHHANLTDTKIPWHWHEELEFGYVQNGKIEVSTINKSYLFEKNEAFFVNTNILCSMKSIQTGIIDSHLFHPVFLSGHFKSIFETKYLDPILQNRKLEILEIRGNTERQRKILKKLKTLTYLQKEENMQFQTRNILSEIWVLLTDEVENLQSFELPLHFTDQERIQTMISFIQQHYQDKISLADIALSAAVSKRECLRCFQHCIQKTPFQYLLDYRIEVAQKLLKTTDMPVIDIALQTGFSNSAYFGKVFKEFSNKTPGAYRKM